MNSSLVHQDNNLIVLNKVNGVSFHAEDKKSGFFAETEARFNEKLWPVHRLDKVTSGLLMLARNKETATIVSSLFESKKINKVYLAISNRKPKKKQGLIIGDMEKARNGSWKLAHSKHNPAVTRFFSCSMGDGMRLYWLLPQTGKTHQLRVAMKSIGAPILGDSRYGGDKSDRTYLHAYQINFEMHKTPFKYQCSPETGEFFYGQPFLDSLKFLVENHAQ